MPSPVHGRRGAKIYKRKGGAIGGKYSRHSIQRDKLFKAHKAPRSYVKRYPQASD